MAKETGRAPTIAQRAAASRKAPEPMGSDVPAGATDPGLSDAPRDTSRHSEAIEVLRTLIREARVETERAQAVFASPYASYHHQQAFFESRGRWIGIGMAIEALMRDQ